MTTNPLIKFYFILRQVKNLGGIFASNILFNHQDLAGRKPLLFIGILKRKCFGYNDPFTLKYLFYCFPYIGV